MEPGADLMLLHPDGKEEVLVPVKPQESIADPFVSFDGQWVYFAKMHDALNHKGADIYKVHVPTRKVVQLTEQTFTPNTGAADWSKTPLPVWGVYNLGPCPVPGGKLAFVSDRNAFKATNPGYAPNALALQLFVMDDDGSNVECIGHLNLGMALHPVILKDGRIMFSSLESQGLRSHHLWGVWSIHPDGTQLGPALQRLRDRQRHGRLVPLPDAALRRQHRRRVVLQPQQLRLRHVLQAARPAARTATRRSARATRRSAQCLAAPRPPRRRPARDTSSFPFSPYGIEALTPSSCKADWPSPPAILKQEDSPRVGKFTHPSAAPGQPPADGLVARLGQQRRQHTPAFDSGIYLIKSGKPVDEPGQMLLIKNDPKYNEQWPRALVPYKRIYGIDEPPVLPPLANDGKQSTHLPEGTPFGLVGTSSLYKRESYPYGVVPPGSVTATFARSEGSAGYRGLIDSHNWTVQGADAGLYDNDDIHAIRILLLEPNTAREAAPRRGTASTTTPTSACASSANSRSATSTGGTQPLDPDGNPDTSFLAKMPGRRRLDLPDARQEQHGAEHGSDLAPVRPGEIRNDCGGCHAHSQKPTRFEDTAAGRADYAVFDLTNRTPLLTTKTQDQSGKKWDVKDETGLRFDNGPQERRVPPRREADPRAQLRRLPHAEIGAARRPARARRRRASSTPTTR